MLTILHVSDLHFGPHHDARVGEALLRAARELQPDIIVNTGDVTESATPSQFEDAWRYLARFPDVPSVIVPGNRDIPLRIHERLFTPYRWYRRFISPERDTVLRHERALVVGLDSTRRRAIANGRVDRRQIALVTREVQAVPPSVVRIVALHHHLAPAPVYGRARTIPRARHVLDRFQQLAIDIILTGHRHHSYIGHSLDFQRGEAGRGIIVAHCGSTTSRSADRTTNSFNLLRISEVVVRLTQFMYVDARNTFAPARRHVFGRRGHEYLIPLARADHSGVIAFPGPLPTGRTAPHDARPGLSGD